MLGKVLMFLFLPIMIFAQSFQATVSDNKVGVKDQFQASFTFAGTDINGIKNFTPPNFNNFMILSGPNQSTSMQIINGAVSASKTYSYYLQPKSIGKYSIGSASINYNGKNFKTDPIDVEVIAGSTKPNSSQSQSSQVSTKDISDNLFIRAIPDKRQVYQGEQVTVTYKLYTRLNIASQMSINKLPQYEGFWAEELNTPNNITFTTEVIDGKQFRVGILKKAALFPSRTGDLSVTPFELNVPVQLRNKRRSGNIFNDFFNDPFLDQTKTMDYDAKSNTINIKVIPLPNKDVPKSFSGAVGDFTLNSELDKTTVKANEPINLKLNISGTGNIKLLDMPEVKLPTGFEKYEPKTSEKINRNGSKIGGTKEFSYLLIPRVAGKMEIPPIKFSYFDLSKKQYVTLSTPPYKINVEQGQGNANIASGEISKEDVKLLDNDIRYIKTSIGDIDQKGSILVYQYGFWIAAGFPLLLLGGLITYKKRNDKLYSNTQLLKFQKAQKIAKARLKQAKDLMNEKNQNEFYSEISLALYGFLEDKLHIAKSEFSLDEAAERLRENSVDDSVINDLKETAEKCEYIRFAPQKDGLAAMNEIYNRSSNIIIEIEKSISSKKHV